jgi:hypothetical protein
MDIKVKTRKRCTSASEVPKTEHYAIIESGSVFVPGDQRSIDHPGHGYPASTEYFVSYISFTDRDEWEAEIRQMTGAIYGKKDFVAMKVTPAEVQTVLTVVIK